MKCPDCQHRLYVLTSTQSPDGEETWRRLRCAKCRKTFYTTEFVVESNRKFKKAFNRARHARERKTDGTGH